MPVARKPAQASAKSAFAQAGVRRVLRQAVAGIRELTYVVVGCGAVVTALWMAHRIGMIG
jgi:hypothetical protein